LIASCWIFKPSSITTTLDLTLQDIQAAQVDPHLLQSVETSLRATLTKLERDTARTFTPAITTLAAAAKENAKALTDLHTLTLPAMCDH